MNGVKRTNSHKNHPINIFRSKLHARALAMYSTVNSATRLVSIPNHTLGLVEWNKGIVSSTVTPAEQRMSAVMRIWMRNAAGDEVGCSSRR